MALSETAPRRAWEETKGVFHNPFFWGVEIIGGAIVTTVVLNSAPFGLSGFPLSLYQTLAPVSYIVGIFVLVFLARLVRAPYVQRDEARALLAGRSEVEVTASYPVVHTETGVPPLGDYLVIPGLHIVNHREVALDCDLDLEVEVQGGTFLLNLENSQIVNLANSLPRGLQGDSQLRQPLQIASKSRAVGCAVFVSDILPEGVLQQRDLELFGEISLLVYDGVDHIEIARHEVWPSIWPEIFRRGGGGANADLGTD